MFLPLLTIIRSNRGSVILTAMIAALSVGVVTAIIMQQAQVTEKQTRAPRIKSAMSSMESQIIEAANSGTLFQACGPSNPNKSSPNCRELSPTKVAQFNTNIAGAQCPNPPAPCGIRLSTIPTETSFSGSTNVLTAKIYYDGTETTIAPRTIVSAIANNAWTAKTAVCPNATPLLVGFDANGDQICKKLPDPCPVTEYVTAVDPMSMTTNAGRTCTALPGLQTCTAGQFIVKFQWTGAGNVNLNCQGLYDPFNPLALPNAVNYAFVGSGGFGNTASWPNAPPGVCGPSNNTAVAVKPTTGLCTTGTSSAVTGSGPWSWSCSGVPVSACSANPPAPSPPWNCHDGWAGAGCGFIIVDEGVVNPANPGAAYIKYTPNIPNGHPNMNCACSSGTLTEVFLDCPANDRYYVCQGATPAPSHTIGEACWGGAGKYTSVGVNNNICEQSCFIAGTQVTLASGDTKNIEDVQIGDMVKTYDEKTDQMTTSPVVTTQHHKEKMSVLYKFKFSDGSTVTSNDVHRFYEIIERRYLSAEEIFGRWKSKMETVLLNEKGLRMTVTSMKRSEKVIKLYNLHVISPYDSPKKDAMSGHNYFAGGVLVHNIKSLGTICAFVGANVIASPGPSNSTGNCLLPLPATTALGANAAGWCCDHIGVGALAADDCPTGQRCNRCSGSDAQMATLDACMANPGAYIP